MEIETIQTRIYDLQGQKVMLDFDLAELYEIENRALKQAVKRNLDRFPADFMFQLTKAEWQELITKCDNLPQTAKFSPATPFAFTEQGVAMLSSVLKSKKALQVNIAIMRVFVEVRRFVLHNHNITEQLKELRERLGEHDTQLNSIYNVMENLLDKEADKAATKANWNNRKRIGYKQDDEISSEQK